MARPQNIEDIEVTDVEFGHIETSKIATDGSLLRAYATFMEAAQKAGAEVTTRYSGSDAFFSRPPTFAEQADQLKSAQTSWDTAKQRYETLRDVGDLEYSHYRTDAENWAKAEGMPWPPESDPITSFDAVIRDIDDAVA